MTYEEARLILATLKAAYPQAYKSLTKVDADIMVKLWKEMVDYPYPIVEAAVKVIIAGSTKEWPPTIGQVNDKIRQISSKEEMTELEAWAYVSKALKNGTYGADEEFKKLPPVIQHLVGSPSQLRSWAAMDADTVESVVASNFQRSYKVRAANEREYLAIPGKVRDFIDGISSGMALPQAPEKTEADFERNRQRMIEAVSTYDTRNTEGENQ